VIVLTTPGFITRGAAESLADVEAQNSQKVADTILDQGKNSGGLIVHLGCGDGRLTVALGANENTLVHGLSDSSIDVDKARRHLQMEQLYGKVSVDTFDGKHLPYVDNLINLLVISVAYDVGQEEMQRVLAPGGHIVFLRPSSSTPLVSQKPWPTHIDQWTHFLHDSSNNAVADDRRHHDGLASVSAMVSADGRLFSLVDEGPVTLVHESARWSLVARDAFNGLLLWKRAFPSWESHLRRFRSGPPELPRRLVAVGDRVYVTLGYGAAVSVLDARTGETVQTFGGRRDGTPTRSQTLVGQPNPAGLARCRSERRHRPCALEAAMPDTCSAIDLGCVRPTSLLSGYRRTPLSGRSLRQAALANALPSDAGDRRLGRTDPGRLSRRRPL